jgi:hypothetical protein
VRDRPEKNLKNISYFLPVFQPFLMTLSGGTTVPQRFFDAKKTES